MKAGFSASAALVLAVFHAAPPALAFGDAETGRAIAERWCSSCHIVSEVEPEVAADAAPTFRSIARDPSLTPDRIYHFLQAPHPPMPDLELSTQDIDHLVAYFEQLAGG